MRESERDSERVWKVVEREKGTRREFLYLYSSADSPSHFIEEILESIICSSIASCSILHYVLVNGSIARDNERKREIQGG